ncbi:hypothetical protein MLD38_013598 [Melastoma candidum]|uniref:Uncharacterized protein n=1 Tax=Melastoma candidum TaxID=119954 RepID=A0ACB9RD69_9MYRT|nr:hypothetical protein MLD38_013598 [Melastoma candidum]
MTSGNGGAGNAANIDGGGGGGDGVGAWGVLGTLRVRAERRVCVMRLSRCRLGVGTVVSGRKEAPFGRGRRGWCDKGEVSGECVGMFMDENVKEETEGSRGLLWERQNEYGDVSGVEEGGEALLK